MSTNAQRHGPKLTRKPNDLATMADVVRIVNAATAKHIASRHTPWYRKLFNKLTRKPQ